MQSDFAMRKELTSTAASHIDEREEESLRFHRGFFLWKKEKKNDENIHFRNANVSEGKMLSASENLKINYKKCTQFACKNKTMNLMAFSEHDSYGLCCAQLELEKSEAFLAKFIHNTEQKR